MTDEWPQREIDHINLDKADNRWRNLREATDSQQFANVYVRADNVSRFKGVHWHKATRKWAAQIQANHKSYWLGCFDSPEGAYIAYMAAAWKHFGQFANFDCPLFVQYRQLKARKKLERTVLWNLARPDPNYLAV